MEVRVFIAVMHVCLFLFQVLHKRQELLKHPLVASFIHHKWNLFGRWVYYPNIALYAFLMLMLTAYIYLRFDCKSTSMFLCTFCYPKQLLMTVYQQHNSNHQPTLTMYFFLSARTTLLTPFSRSFASFSLSSLPPSSLSPLPPFFPALLSPISS